MYCKRCGTDLPRQATHCPRCGMQVAHASSPFSKLKALNIAIITCFSLAVVIGLYLFIRLLPNYSSSIADDSIDVAASVQPMQQSETPTSINFDECIELVYEECTDPALYPYVRGLEINIYEEDHQIYFVAVLDDGTSTEIVYTYANILIHKFHLEVEKQETAIETTADSYYGGLYDTYDIVMGIGPYSQRRNTSEWWVYQIIQAGTHEQISVKIQDNAIDNVAPNAFTDNYYDDIVSSMGTLSQQMNTHATLTNALAENFDLVHNDEWRTETAKNLATMKTACQRIIDYSDIPDEQTESHLYLTQAAQEYITMIDLYVEFIDTMDAAKLTEAVHRMNSANEYFQLASELISEEAEGLSIDQSDGDFNNDQATAANNYSQDAQPELSVPVPDSIADSESESIQPTDTIVFITDTGAKYHRSNCRHLKSKIEITLTDAKSQGYGPCGTCKPAA